MTTTQVEDRPHGFWAVAADQAAMREDSSQKARR